MQIPTAFYGSDAVVRENLRPVVESYLRSGSWPESFTGRTIDPGTMGGAETWVAFTCSEYLRLENHFQVYLLGDLLESLKTVPPGIDLSERITSLFDSLIVYDWGFLCLLCKSVILPNFRHDKPRSVQFFQRFMAIREDLFRHRRMYSNPGNVARSQYGFWNISFTNFFESLVRAGVPKELLVQNPPPIFTDDRVLDWIDSYILAK